MTSIILQERLQAQWLKAESSVSMANRKAYEQKAHYNLQAQIQVPPSKQGLQAQDSTSMSLNPKLTNLVPTCGLAERL